MWPKVRDYESRFDQLNRGQLQLPSRLSVLVPLEDALDFRLGRFGRVLGAHYVASHLGKHGGKDEGFDHLVDRCRGIARKADDDTGGAQAEAVRYLKEPYKEDSGSRPGNP